MKLNIKSMALLVAISALPMVANAHRAWMLPSSTVFSANEPWVSVDAAVSNDIFYFEHNAMNLDNLVLFAPDGSPIKAENQSKGRYRSTFDVKLSAKGTYKIAVINDSVMASYKLGADTKRLRGKTLDDVKKEIPAGAEVLSVSESISRMEVFVTSGKPSEEVLKPNGRGLEMVPVTHPNDLFVGDTAKFRFLLDGKPAEKINVTLIRHGIRYRNNLEELKLVSDAQGEVAVKWAEPGMYWLNAAPPRAGVEMGPPPAANAADASAPVAAPQRPRGPQGTLAEPVRRTGYTATLEVLPQ